MAGAQAGLEVLNKALAVGMNGQYLKLILVKITFLNWGSNSNKP